MQTEQKVEESNAYSLFVYAIRSPLTRDYYLRRLRIFFNHINLMPNETMEERCNYFAKKGIQDPNWAFSCVIKFLQFQKDRVQREEITGATLRNFVKSIKLFCEMSDIVITWKKITRGLPKIRRHADDRAPTIEEIQKICEYPDRRIRGIVCTMASCGIRLGAWDNLTWGHIKPVKREEKVVAAKIIVYGGDDEEYFSFITPEAYFHLEKWMNYRTECGEKIDENSWVMRQLWNTREGHYHHGTIKDAAKLQSSGIKRLIEDSLWTQGIRRKSNLKGNRYEFQTDHGFRKWFKTRCELAGMKSINIEILMGHSIGISDSYYRVTEDEILNDYLKAVDHLAIDNEHSLRKEIDLMTEKSKIDYDRLRIEPEEREQEIRSLQQKDFSYSDTISALADQVSKLMKEIDDLKKGN
jgi:hypothetical protein